MAAAPKHLGCRLIWPDPRGPAMLLTVMPEWLDLCARACESGHDADAILSRAKSDHQEKIENLSPHPGVAVQRRLRDEERSNLRARELDDPEGRGTTRR